LENDVIQFVEENDAIFIQTSACSGKGINNLFEEIGNRIMDPNYKDEIIKKRDSKLKKKNSNNLNNINIKNVNDDNKNNNFDKINDNNAHTNIKGNDIKRGKSFKLDKNDNNNNNKNKNCCI
jgi:putative protein kinase ArgK-like GTPase of G3E family